MEKLFKALGDRTRLEILLLVASNPGICLCHLDECFNLSMSNLSRHLKELENSDLLDTTKIGKWKHYTLSPFGVEFVELIKKIDTQDLYKKISNKHAILNSIAQLKQQ